MNELAKRTLYVNPNIRFLSNSNIVEYDMKNAGFSLIKKYDMLPKKKIEELEKIGKEEKLLDKKYGKQKQTILIGKLQRENKELATKIKVAFEIERENFMTKNQLSEHDIISIKKDAFFVSTTKVIDGTIDKFIKFRKKNSYSSYLYIKPLEIYYKRGIDLEVKGISEDKQEVHGEYMYAFIQKALHAYETRELPSVLYMMTSFIDKYKQLQLEPGYYRELNAQSKFSYLDGEKSEIEYRENLSELDIMTNFQILLQMLQYFLEK